MKQDFIQQGSSLIASFLGWVPCSDCGNNSLHFKYGPQNWQVCEVSDMKFHTSFDAIMPAIIKWNQLIESKQQVGNGPELKKIQINDNIEVVFTDLVDVLKNHTSTNHSQ